MSRCLQAEKLRAWRKAGGYREYEHREKVRRAKEHEALIAERKPHKRTVHRSIPQIIADMFRNPKVRLRLSWWVK